MRLILYQAVTDIPVIVGHLWISTGALQADSEFGESLIDEINSGGFVVADDGRTYAVEDGEVFLRTLQSMLEGSYAWAVLEEEDEKDHDSKQKHLQGQHDQDKHAGWDGPAITPSQSLISRVHDVAWKGLGRLARDYPPGSADDYYAHANEILQKIQTSGIVSTRVPAEVASTILTERVFKNQFATNTSKGILDHDARGEAEENLFGIDRNNNNWVQRPIYGYVNMPNKPTNAESNYGSVEFRFKDSIKRRTTITGDDSLGEDSVPRPFGKLKPDDVGSIYYSMVGATLGKGTTSAAIFDFIANQGYIEAQIHGTAKIEDISEVVLHTPRGFRHNMFDTIIAKLKELAIPFSESNEY